MLGKGGYSFKSHARLRRLLERAAAAKGMDLVELVREFRRSTEKTPRVIGALVCHETPCNWCPDRADSPRGQGHPCRHDELQICCGRMDDWLDDVEAGRHLIAPFLQELKAEGYLEAT